MSALGQKSIPVELHKNSGKKKLFSKVFIAEGYYENGNLKFKGEFLKCTTRDPRGYYDIYESRRIGPWIYYHPNGNIERIENYTHNTSCSQSNFKSGKWQYWNDRGELYFEEEYRQDTLVAYEVEIYNKHQLIQKFVRNSKGIDTVRIASFATNNLIPNADFENYKYRPVKIENSGQNHIEDLIPYWSSPDGNTPDYYNFNRMVKGVFNIIDSDTVQNGFVGLVLFHNESDRYLEHLQTKLTSSLDAGMKYCYKMKIRLSQNSGFYIDRFGIRLFSQDPFGGIHRNQNLLAQIDFQKPLNQTQQWVTLCDSFIAKGGEKFLVMGRYAETSEVHVQRHTPKYENKLDVNKSAYYLVDNLELFAASSPEECGCEREKINFENSEVILPGDKVILSNVNFESNSADLSDSSLPELEKLKNILLSKPFIKISILGHTDDMGDENYNLALSKKRAKAVKDWLIANGISSERLTDKGYGFSDPLTDNLTEENRQLNRRVEIVIE